MLVIVGGLGGGGAEGEPRRRPEGSADRSGRRFLGLGVLVVLAR